MTAQEQIRIDELYTEFCQERGIVMDSDNDRFDYWYHHTGHWIYQDRAEAMEAWNRGLA